MVIEIHLSEFSKVDAIATIMKNFLKNNTVRIFHGNEVTVADYSQYEGLRFFQKDSEYIALLDGRVTDIGQSVLDLYERITAIPLKRSHNDATQFSSI